MYNQSSSYVNKATPLFTQCEDGRELGSRKNITKFVECPVVESVPLLIDVLYIGQL